MSLKPTVKTLRSSDGTLIHAEAVGDPRKPCVVLVPGLHMSCLAFEGIFNDPRLLDEVFLVRYDLRGHGRSGKPDDSVAYRSSLFADDFAAVMREFKMKQPIYVGWSYGGTVPYDIYTYLGPNSLFGLVYLGGLSSVSMLQCCVTPLATELLRGHISRDAVTFRSTVCDFVDACFNDAAAVDVRHKMTYLGPAFLQTAQVTEALLTRRQDPAKLMEAGRKGLPLLLINAGSDKLVNGDMVTKEMKRHFKDLQVHTVNGGSHALFDENREEVVRVLLTFIRRLTLGYKEGVDDVIFRRIDRQCMTRSFVYLNRDLDTLLGASTADLFA